MGNFSKNIDKKNYFNRCRFYLISAFTDHPHEIDETYVQHLIFTLFMSLRFARVSIAILIHGIFPFMFIRTASDEVEKIYEIMKSRKPIGPSEINSV